jgi:hypothetical protein
VGSFFFWFKFLAWCIFLVIKIYFLIIMQTNRSILESLRQDPSWDERWRDVAQGLITSWERGREKSIEEPELAFRALNGELVSLPWKGGFLTSKAATSNPKKTSAKQVKKYGVFNYLAMWQGLRAEDLEIDPSQDVELMCSVNKKTVVFTSTYSQYANSVDSE